MATFQGIPGFGLITSSSGTINGQVQGLPFTRLKGVAVSGTIADGVLTFPTGVTGPGPLPPAGGVVVIQSTASISNQIISTSSNAVQNSGFIYIPVTTGSAVSFNAAVAPPYTGCGTALIWNDNAATLHVWSSSRAAWMAGVAGSSQTGNVTFSTS